MRILMILAITMAEVAALVTLARSQQGSPTGVQKGAVSAKRSVATHEEPLVLKPSPSRTPKDVLITLLWAEANCSLLPWAAMHSR